jgi:hypothetical protein
MVDDGVFLFRGPLSLEKLPDFTFKGIGEVAERPGLGKVVSPLDVRQKSHGNAGLLSEYLPKKTSFDTLTQKQFDTIVAKINNRPRKVLGYLTPYEAFSP